MTVVQRGNSKTGVISLGPFNQRWVTLKGLSDERIEALVNLFKTTPTKERDELARRVFGAPKNERRTSRNGLSAKHGLCAICGSHKKLNRDHCHKTGLNRGELCLTCNAGIGMLKDSPTVLRAAALYLERFTHADS